MKTLALIDYGAGNLRSAAKAFEEAGGDHWRVLVARTASELAAASHIVLPGVGAFGDCMSGLRAVSGMVDALGEAVLQRKKNFLGICVGMQMLFARGYEHGEHAGLGWLEGEVVSLGTRQEALGIGALTLKIPHMGWNELSFAAPQHPLLRGLEAGAHAYFVHSYHATKVARDAVIATTDYGQEVVTVVGLEHIMGTQFHPEKSQDTGLTLIRNFLDL